MKPLRLSALAAALALAACSSSAPTDPALLDSAPSFDEGPGMVGSGNKDGGGMLGSGNDTMEDGGVGTMGSGGGTSATGSTTATDTGGTTTSSDSTTQRGPGMMGSGN